MKKSLKISFLILLLSIVLNLFLLFRMDKVYDRFVREDYFYPDGTFCIQGETDQYLAFKQRREFFYYEQDNILFKGNVEDLERGYYKLVSPEKEPLGTVVFRNKNSIVFVPPNSEALLMDKVSDVTMLLKKPD